MGILSFLLLAVIVITIILAVKLPSESKDPESNFRQQISYIRSVGLFAMITGILGQLIGLYMAFVAIEKAGDISPMLVAAGLKISMITTLYGVFIYLFSILCWFALSLWYDRLQK